MQVHFNKHLCYHSYLVITVSFPLSILLLIIQTLRKYVLRRKSTETSEEFLIDLLSKFSTHENNLLLIKNITQLLQQQQH